LLAAKRKKLQMADLEFREPEKRRRMLNST
jgi:hypothetical protein